MAREIVSKALTAISVLGANDSWANLRRKNSGRDEPHNVKYWGLGNESTSLRYGRIATLSHSVGSMASRQPYSFGLHPPS